MMQKVTSLPKNKENRVNNVVLNMAYVPLFEISSPYPCAYSKYIFLDEIDDNARCRCDICGNPSITISVDTGDILCENCQEIVMELMS